MKREIAPTTAEHHLHVVEAIEHEAPPERLGWMPLYCGDFLMISRGWSFEAKGLYFEFLILQWGIGALPADQAALRKLVNMSSTMWRRTWPEVAAEFPRDGEGRRNAQLARLRDEATARRASAITKAKHAARARWGTAS